MLAWREGATMGADESSRDRHLSALFVSYYDSLRRLAFVLLGDGDAAEEIVMEVFAKSLSRWSLLRKVEWPPAYLRRMVVNECRTRMRRQSIEQRVNALIHREQTELMSWFDGGDDHLDIWRAVRALPHRQRICVVLRYLEDLPEQEVADVLDCPIGTVKSQLSRARAKLAGVLGERAPVVRRLG